MARFGEAVFFWALVLVTVGVIHCLDEHVHPQKLHYYMSKRDLSRYFGVDKHDEVPEYDIVHPVQVDSEGEYLTHHLSRVFRRSTDAFDGHDEHNDVHYKVKAFDEDLHLSLKKNDHLLGPNLVSNVLGKNGKVRRSTVPKNCYYHGLARSQKSSKVAISNCKGLSGLIKTTKASYFIEPLPHHLRRKIKRNGVKQAHLIYKNHGYHSHKRTTSNGKIKEIVRVVNFCGTKDNTSIHIDPLSSDDEMGSKRAVKGSSNVGRSGAALIIETYLVVDQKMTNFHGIDMVEQFALAAMNIASRVLYDSTIGTSPVKLTLVKMSILTAPQAGLSIVVHAANTLNSLGQWAAKENKADDNDPDHFDHAVLLTRYNICADKNEPCDTLGLAPVSGMCRFPVSVTVNQDNGFLVGMTIAHETGHNLGMNHDYVGGCKNGETVMSTSAPGKSSAFSWSACSRKYLDTFCKLEQAACLNDEPQKRLKDFSKLQKPGVLYDANTQCASTFTSGWTFCDYPNFKKQMCHKMWCASPTNPLSCATVFQPAAEGTECGKDMWCEKGVCVKKGKEPPNAVDGGWSHWSNGAKCTRPCGGGILKQLRACNNPQPQNGGKDCEGEAVRYQTCKAKPCPPGAPAFLDVQCKDKNDILYGDKKFQWEWRPALDLSHPCELGCFFVNKNIGYELGPVTDGSDCKTTTVPKGKCVNRICKEVGCDGIIGSTAKLDRCGVCNGDGSSCKPKLKTLHRSTIAGAKMFTWATKTLPCTATCAGGVLVVTSECKRTDDGTLVGETFCNAGERPPKKETPCSVSPCPATWRTDEWNQCTKTCNTGAHQRTVKCVQVVKGDIEEDIDETICTKTGIIRPPTTENCNKFPCTAEWLAKTFAPCSTTCGVGVRQRAIVCVRPDRNGANVEIPGTECKDLVRPFDTAKCNQDKPCPGQGGCGGKFGGVNGIIRSPGFPNDYPNDQDCVYSITVQPGKKVKLSFNSFKLDTANEGDLACSGDRLEIFDGDCSKTENAAVTKYCGNTKPDAYISTANILCVKFISDAAKAATGFDVNYSTCTGTCGVTPPVTQPAVGQNTLQTQPQLGTSGQTQVQAPIRGKLGKALTSGQPQQQPATGSPPGFLADHPAETTMFPNRGKGRSHTPLYRQRHASSGSRQRETLSSFAGEDNEYDTNNNDQENRYYHESDSDDDNDKDSSDTADDDGEDDNTTDAPLRSSVLVRVLKKDHAEKPPRTSK